MADQPATSPTTPDAARPGRAHPYRALLASRVRSQLSYRTSFAFDVFNSLSFAVLESVEVYLIFHKTAVLGGLGVVESFLVFALARSGFALADLVAGQLDTIPGIVRAGTLDTMMLRPLPVLAQLILGDVQLRRLARLTLYVVLLIVILPRAPVDWTSARVALVPATVVGGGLIFTAVFIAAGALQFRLVDGGEVANAFTYGGGYVASYSTAVLPAPARAFFTAVIPAAFVGYLPTLALLGQGGPAGLPGWLGWYTLPVGLLTLVVALALWRNGLRHYQGGGG
ncbi:MAG: ABC-2 family transporter protein [Kineosporiaceae bacterium]